MEGGFATAAPLIRTPGWRTKVHTLLHRPSETYHGRMLRICTFAVIILSTLCFILQSLPELASWHTGWKTIDAIVAMLFTVEYVLKLIVAPDGRGDEEHDDRQRAAPASAWKARLRFAGEPMSIIDLMAFLPWWLGLILPFAAPWFLQVLRALRLVRILRTLRLAQESKELRILVGCVIHSLPALRMLCFFLILDLVIVGGLTFHAERGDGDEHVNPATGKWEWADGTEAEFQSIPDAMWWALVTVTTVGYGGQEPKTLLGRIIASIAMLTGLVGISSIISIIQIETYNLRPTARMSNRTVPTPTMNVAPMTAGLVAGDSMAPTPGSLRPLTLGAGPGISSTSSTSPAGGAAPNELERQVATITELLKATRQRCADNDPSKAACLACLEDTALHSLKAFAQIALQGSGLAVSEPSVPQGGGGVMSDDALVAQMASEHPVGGASSTI